MGRRKERIKIADGIWRDAIGITVIAHVRGAGQKEKRFPLAVPVDDLLRWQNETRVRLLDRAERGSKPGTFARDAQQYLNAFTKHLASRKSRRIEIRAWIKEFGERPRGTITPADVARVRTKWLTEKQPQPRGLAAKVLSPKTVNNRVAALRHMYHALDGKRAWTPVDDIAGLSVHRTPIVRIDDALLLKVEATLQAHERHKFLKTAKTRARFRVLVTTGRRPSEVMRALAEDVDLERRVWVPRDGKGGFSPGLYLNDDMLAAWRLFVEADAWGPFSTNSFARVLRTAGWPTGLRPYQARHTLGITMSERGVDLDDVGAQLGHKRRETTRKHYVPVLNSRVQRASESIDGRFGGWRQPQIVEPRARRGPATSPAARVKSDKNRPKVSGARSQRKAG